jgi:hypothetical protein
MSITDTSTSAQAVKHTYEPYRVSIEEYVTFHMIEQKAHIK